MANLKNHPGMWLRDDAAAAINALEDKYGVIVINSAGRTVQDQQSLINRWNQGGTYNRPPYLFQPASPANTSNHVKDGGIAVDVYNFTTDRAKLQEFGFEWYGNADKVHYTFRGWNGGTVIPFEQVTQDRQNWLNASRGAQLNADGRQGPLTTEEIKKYQIFLRDWGYGYTGEIDGDWGAGTQEAHQGYWNAFNTKHPNTGRGAKGQWVKDIQYRLNIAGFPVRVDGDFGPATDKAVRDFQRSRNLTVDGIVGTNTRRPLGL